MKNTIHKIASKPYLIFFIFIFIALAIYLPIYHIGFISDDWGFVYQMEHAGWSAFTYNFTDKFFIPVSHVLGTLQYQVTGGNPIIQHIIQVIIHGIIAWQIFMLCRGISQRMNYKDLIPIGAIAGLLFLINPFQVEAVAWLASKSYGYTLLFSLLALRVITNQNNGAKKQLLFWFLTLLAIHCKEWAYVLPFIAFCIMKIAEIKIDKYFWAGLTLTFLTSLFLRYLSLGTLIGGYETGHSFNIITIAAHTAAYFIKFTTYLRLASTEFLPLPLLAIFSIILILFFFNLLIKTKPKKTNIFFFFCIVILTILPVAGLEISSFFSIQSDRYSYFALVPFSIIYAYVLINLKKWLSIISLSALCVIFILFTLDYGQRWSRSSKVQYTFLETLLPEVNTNSRVLIYNVPDTFNDVYCMRNGIEPFLKVNGKEVDIEVYQRQDFYTMDAGSIQNGDLSFKTVNANNTYTTFPKDVISNNTIPFEKSWLSEFDKTLIYANTTFTPINLKYEKNQ